ncbi:MAG: HD-GYP domain-containing protein [Phycisphaerae bacterium]|nr:HD-GYP domain-containing protein [Phycisphaerae bacterium]MDD5381246.1 HD-GYP domain-containing protein [Phycisphaerae bacterium]
MLNAIEKDLSPLQLRGLKSFGGKTNKLGVNFAVCNADNKVILLCDGGKFKSDQEQLIKLSQQVIKQSNKGSGAGTEDRVCRFDEGNQVLAVVLKSDGVAVGAALIDRGRERGEMSDEGQIMNEMLGFLAESFQTDGEAEKQIDMVSNELAQTYEELVLLHKLSTNMKVTEPDATFLQMACDSLADIVSVEGMAILLERAVEGEKRLVLSAGLGLIDVNEQMASVLKNRLVGEINNGHEALLDSEVDSHFKYNWPANIKSIIAVPLWGRLKGKSFPSSEGSSEAEEALRQSEKANSIIGLMVAINRVDKPDFDSTDAKLFNSVANGCAIFIDNGKLFRDLEELFIGSLKALTSSIDAKDPYTRGHSERVAFISRWIAERIDGEEPLEREEMHKIYLTGLLHDIGKMGIDDAVLRKKGKLTEEEMNDIRKHPSIGAGILSGIKQMRDIVPGVLYHHERSDGKGYPTGLTGKQIPLVGKIVGLADSFDAMTSKRTYRDAMTVDEARAEIEKGLGTQFDEKVGRVFINSDLHQLWGIMQEGFSEIYGSGNLSEYGISAVGELVR